MNLISFRNQKEFRDWLDINHNVINAIWIKFDKRKETSQLTAEQALDEALCYGWIDSVIKRIDDQFYMKYFAQRRKNSIWSTKNKKAIERLLAENKMMPAGLAAVEIAKQNGRWDQADANPIDYSLSEFTQLISSDAQALANFLNFSQSIQKTYAMSYYALKKPESRKQRLEVIVSRLKNNMKPM